VDGVHGTFHTARLPGENLREKFRGRASFKSYERGFLLLAQTSLK